MSETTETRAARRLAIQNLTENWIRTEQDMPIPAEGEYVPRYAGIETDGHGDCWLHYGDTAADAAAKLGQDGDGAWAPWQIVDLDTGEAFDAVVAVTVGPKSQTYPIVPDADDIDVALDRI